MAVAELNVRNLELTVSFCYFYFICLYIEDFMVVFTSNLRLHLCLRWGGNECKKEGEGGFHFEFALPPSSHLTV